MSPGTEKLEDFVRDFADALAALDASGKAHKNFRPGIGPWGEADAVRAALLVMQQRFPSRYSGAACKRTPDLLIPGKWAIELKVIRPFGDNGKSAEHWSENILHPYSGNTSALGDCLKLLACGLPERKAVVIFGFEHNPPQVPLEPAVRGFELLASSLMGVRLGPRVSELRTGLVHPVHEQLRVFGFEVLGYT